MPRFARAVLAGCAHHITQRGNNRQDVFFVDDDRRAYLAFLRQEADKHGLRVHAYCLLSNHVHLIPVPEAADSAPSPSVALERRPKEAVRRKDDPRNR
ncbi:MAG TPA: transposase [Phycisphaerae bacterium]|nr:transposase [Phycisphaerae bacterium]